MRDTRDWDGGPLMGPPRRPEHRFRDPRPGRLLGVWAFAMAALAGAAVLLHPPPPEPTGEKHAPPLAMAEFPELVTFVDVRDDSTPVIGHPLPEHKKPPCLEGMEVEFPGGCWVALAHKPPCPLSTAEHQGKCYLPVSERRPEPRAMRP